MTHIDESVLSEREIRTWFVTRHEIGAGMRQGLGHARTLNVPFVFHDRAHPVPGRSERLDRPGRGQRLPPHEQH